MRHFFAVMASARPFELSKAGSGCAQLIGWRAPLVGACPLHERRQAAPSSPAVFATATSSRTNGGRWSKAPPLPFARVGRRSERDVRRF